MGIRRLVEVFVEPTSEALIELVYMLSHLHNGLQVDRAVHLEEDLYIIVEKKGSLAGDLSPLV